MSTNMVRGIRTERLLVSGVTLLATALRFQSLGAKSLWGDEINTAVLFVQMPVSYIATHFHPNNHTLYSIMAHLFTLQGSNEFLLRMPAGLLGIAAVPAVYQLGRSLSSVSTGVVAAFLLAIAPWHLWFSQEARGYSGAVLFSILSAVFLFRALKQSRRWDYAGFVIATSLALYIHLFTILFVASELCILVGRLLLTIRSHGEGGRDPLLVLRPWAISLLCLALLLAILFSPLWLAWLSLIDETYGGAYLGSPGYTTDWGLDVQSFARLLRSLGGSLTRNWHPVTTVCLTCFGLGLITSLSQRPRSALSMTGLLVIPILLLAALTAASSGFYVYMRFLLILLPPFLLFAADGIVFLGRLAQRFAFRADTAPMRGAGVSLAVAVVLLGIPALPALREVYRATRQDWRGVGDYLSKNARPGDAVVQTWLLQKDSLRWYFHPPDEKVRVYQASDLRGRSLEVEPGGQVYWVFVHNGQAERLAQEVEGRFEVQPFEWLAVLWKSEGVSVPEEAWDGTLSLLRLQGEFGQPPGGGSAYQALVEDLLRSEGPGLALSYVERGEREVSRGEWRAAASSFETAVRYQPHSGLTHTKLANAYRALGRLEEAKASYLRSIEVDPGYVGAYLNLGWIYEREGREEEALVLYETAVKIAPDSPWAQSTLGSAYRRAGELAKGVAHLERAVQLEPDHSAWLLPLADAYRALGWRDKAVAAYKQILILTPGSQPAIEALEALETGP